MQFNTFLFLLCFLPVCVTGYYLAGRSGRGYGRWWMLVASAVFYSCAGLENVLLLCGSILVGYGFVLGIRRCASSGKKGILIAGVCTHILFLFYFKYLNFTIQSINDILHTSLNTYRILLPLGASFYTFQQIGYLVDTYRDETKEFSFTDYMLYILFFPKLTMGPLARAQELIPQFHDPNRQRFDAGRLMRGIRLFNLGLAKKVLLADAFAQAAAWGYEHAATATSLELFLTSVAYTMQIYFDFSGYSDMARGVSEMLGIDLPVNFDSPYQAISIQGFWKRWHMSLTAFFTRYVYIPMGGNRKGRTRTLLHVLIVFLISGIWHGANYTFILWGLLHAVCYMIEELLDPFLEKMPRAVRWFVTFQVVNVLWLLFNSESITQWLQMLYRMVTVGGMIVTEGFYRCFYERAQSAWPVALYYAIAFALCLGFKNTAKRSYPMRAVTALGAAVLFFCSLVSLSKEAIFVYFGF